LSFSLSQAAQREAQAASAQAAKLERDLGNARTAAIAKGLGVKSHLQALKVRLVPIPFPWDVEIIDSFPNSYDEQVEVVSRLKEDTVRAILKNSQEIATFKQEVSRHLQELRDFVEVD
jgi:kinetochore protein NDC80